MYNTAFMAYGICFIYRRSFHHVDVNTASNYNCYILILITVNIITSCYPVSMCVNVMWCLALPGYRRRYDNAI